MIFIGFLLIFLNFNRLKAEELFKNAFVNEPVNLDQVYHFPNVYEEKSYDFWYENQPKPHVHGDQPKFYERHQHFQHDDNYDFSKFITDAPNQNLINPREKEDSRVLESPLIEKNLEKHGKFMQIQVQPANIVSEPTDDYYDDFDPVTSTVASSPPTTTKPMVSTVLPVKKVEIKPNRLPIRMPLPESSIKQPGPSAKRIKMPLPPGTNPENYPGSFFPSSAFPVPNSISETPPSNSGGYN